MGDKRIEDYKDLIVWKRAMELAAAAYRIVRMLPQFEVYALGDQIRRAAVSIPSKFPKGMEEQARRITPGF